MNSSCLGIFSGDGSVSRILHLHFQNMFIDMASSGIASLFCTLAEWMMLDKGLMDWQRFSALSRNLGHLWHVWFMLEDFGWNVVLNQPQESGMNLYLEVSLVFSHLHSLVYTRQFFFAGKGNHVIGITKNFCSWTAFKKHVVEGFLL